MRHKNPECHYAPPDRPLSDWAVSDDPCPRCNGEPVEMMELAIECLAYELPHAVWKDVYRRWLDVKALLVPDREEQALRATDVKPLYKALRDSGLPIPEEVRREAEK